MSLVLRLLFSYFFQNYNLQIEKAIALLHSDHAMVKPNEEKCRFYCTMGPKKVIMQNCKFKNPCLCGNFALTNTSILLKLSSVLKSHSAYSTSPSSVRSIFKASTVYRDDNMRSERYCRSFLMEIASTTNGYLMAIQTGQGESSLFQQTCKQMLYRMDITLCPHSYACLLTQLQNLQRILENQPAHGKNPTLLKLYSQLYTCYIQLQLRWQHSVKISREYQ